MTTKNNKPLDLFLSEKLRDNGYEKYYSGDEISDWIKEFWTNPQVYDPNYLRIKMELWKENYLAIVNNPKYQMTIKEIADDCNRVVNEFDKKFNTPPNNQQKLEL